MKKFLLRLLLLNLTILISITFLIVFVAVIIPPQFSGEYQSVINRKYNVFVKINVPKIVYVSGSSGTFCVDDKLVSTELNMPFINLGLHASYGVRFELEMSKANINSGDIVILGFEESTYGDNLNTSDIYLMASGINDNFHMLKYFSNYQMVKFLNYFPTYVLKKIDRYIDNYQTPNGIYSSNSFDEDGIFVFERDTESERGQNIVDIPELKGSFINGDILNYLKEYKEFINSKGANVYIVFPPVSMNSISSSEEQHDNFKLTFEQRTGIKVINCMEEIMFDNNYLYDYNYHCNNVGQEKYTNLLIDRVKNIVKETKPNENTSNGF